MRKTIPIAIAALAMAGCTVVPDSRGTANRAPSSERSTASVRTAPAPQRSAAPALGGGRPSERQCLARLGGTGARFTPLPDRHDGRGCTNLNTVQLIALRSDDAALDIANLGPVTCPVSQAFARWARYGADRAARQFLGAPLERIETFGSYACRNVAGTNRRSAHASAEAIDISGFVLADGRRISVQQDWDGGNAQERQFLRVVQQSACKRFATVLGPEYNAAHKDHFHVEGVIDGTSYCR